MNVDTEGLENPPYEQSQQQQLEQLLTNLENQEDQEDQHHGIAPTIQAMSKMSIKSSDCGDLMQDENTDQNMTSDDSGSSYRLSEVMCTRPGTPDNLSTIGA